MHLRESTFSNHLPNWTQNDWTIGTGQLDLVSSYNVVCGSVCVFVWEWHILNIHKSITPLCNHTSIKCLNDDPTFCHPMNSNEMFIAGLASFHINSNIVYEQTIWKLAYKLIAKSSQERRRKRGRAWARAGTIENWSVFRRCQRRNRRRGCCCSCRCLLWWRFTGALNKRRLFIQ